MLRSGIEMLTSFVEDYPELDSDGASRLIQVVLHDFGASYKTMSGYAEDTATCEIVQPHFWVQVGKFIIDYKLRKWLGEDAPHGVFMPREAERFEYVGIETPFSLDTSRLLHQAVTSTPTMMLIAGMVKEQGK